MIKSVLQIQMNDPISSEYNVSVNDGKDFKILSCNGNTNCSIRGLKPCTSYTVTVYAHNGTEILCQSPEKKETTASAVSEDIKVSKHRRGHVCYQSEWDICNSLSKPDRNKTCDESICFKLKEEDFCSGFTVEFSQNSCKNSSFSITEDITIDFIEPAEISQTTPTTLPAKIEPELPPKCKNLTVEYTCSEIGKAKNNVALSDLEPYTHYSCTGEIKNKTFVFVTTPPVTFNIDCGFQIFPKATPNITSIKLTWRSTNTSCDVDLPKLSYNCSCKNNESIKASRNEICVLNGLKPYTDYTCEIYPIYNNKRIPNEWRAKVQTKAGDNNKVVFGLLSLITFFIFLTLTISVIKLRKLSNFQICRSHEVEEMTPNATAIYTNVPHLEKPERR